MGRFAHHLNTVLNVICVAASVALVVLGIVSLTGGPTLRFVPYMAAVCAFYYLCMAVKYYLQNRRGRVLKGSLLLLLALACAAFCYIAYRCLI